MKGNINILNTAIKKAHTEQTTTKAKEKKGLLYKIPGIKFLIHFAINGPAGRRWKTRAVSRVTKLFCRLGLLLFLNKSPVTPYKRLSVKCMLSLENLTLGLN